MKYLAYLMTALMLVATVDAKDKTKNAQKGKQSEKQKEREKERQEREARSKAIKDYLDGKDTNHDGSLSKDEFMAGESDAAAAAAKFDKANKNGDRMLAKSEIADMLGL